MTNVRRYLLIVSLAATLLVAGVLLAAGRIGDDLYRALGNLGEVLYLVSNNYVDPVDPEHLEAGLEAGLLWSLDPAAALVDSHEIDAFEAMTAAPPAFGLVLTQRLDSAAVRQVLPGSPAEQAGIEQWEIIEQIDGVNSMGRALWRLRMELWQQFEAARPVELTIVDRSVDERRTVVLQPEPWPVQPFTTEKLREVTVVTVGALPAGSADELKALLRDAAPVVLDLRSLVWGLEQEAIAVADLFAAEGVLGQWHGRKAGERQFTATAPVVAPELPIVVIGAQTEGVGEVLTAALTRLGAELVGQQTAGRAPHLQMVHEDDLHLWLPVGTWLGPHDDPLDGEGIEPAVVVEADEDDPDRAVDRAVELLLERYAEAA